MHAKDIIKNVVGFSYMVSEAYVKDLTDQELLTRSVPGANHIAWQLGHLLSSSAQMLQAIGQDAPTLPDGFVEAHTKETKDSDDPARFYSKDEYLKHLEQMKVASLNAIDAIPDDQLQQPGPEPMRAYFPQVHDVLVGLGTHWLMHAGQWVPVRRKLGKAPLF